MGKYYLGTGNQQINFQVVDSTGVINDLNLSGLYLSITGKAADADKLDNFDSSFFRNAANLTGIYTGQISGGIGNADTLDGLDSSYFLNGANITGTVALSGTFTGYYTGAFSGTITHTDSITFHTGLGINPDPAELTWSDDVGTMQLGLQGGNIDLRVGLQNYEYVTNRNASTLSKGSVVYISGAQGNRPAVALALANADSTSAVTFGILAENIASMANGYAITNGLLTNLNTTGFAEGAALYLSPTVSGAVISSKPQAPNHSVLVGFCVRSHASAGEILVKIQNGVELDELHDVRITSAQNNDIIRYNAPSGVWFNSNTLALNGTGSHYISGDLGIGTSSPNAKLHIFGADKRQIITSTTDNAALVLGQWDGATNRIESSTRKLLITSYANGISLGVNGSENVHVSTSGYLGVGTTSPQFKLDVNGIASIAQSYYLNKGFADGVEEYLIRGSAGSWNGFISYTPSSSTANRGFKFGAWDNGGNRNDWVSIWNGDVGIGTTAPSQKLEVRGNIKLGGDNSGNYIYYVTDIERTILRTTRSDVTQEGLMRSDGWGNFTFNKSIAVGYSLGSGPLTGNIYASGSVGIGTTSVSNAKLTVSSTISATASPNYFDALNLYNQSDGGARIIASNSIGTYSAIEMGVLSSGAGTDDGVIRFSTATNGTLSTKVVIDNSGNVGIGTTSPLTILNLSGGGGAVYQTFTDTTNAYHHGYIGKNGGGLVFGFSSQNGSFSADEKMRITTSGNVGIGTTTPSYKLHVVGDARIGANGQRIWLYDDGNAHVHATSGPLWLNSDDASGIYINNQNNGNVILTNGTGRVGIGTTTPGYKLHIGDNSATASAHMMLDGVFGNTTAASHARIYFSDTNFGIGAGGWASSGSDDDLYLWAYDGSGRDIRFAKTSDGTSAVNTANWTTNMIIKNDGSVGIGTTTPYDKLEVAGGIAATGYTTGNASQAHATLIGVNGGTSYLQAVDWGAEYKPLNIEGKTISLQTGTGSTSSRFYIDNSGNVGVGTTSPTSLFTVQGSQSEIHVKHDATRAITIGNWDGTAQYIKSINLGVALTPLVLQASRFTFDTGNVGIGNTNPLNKLDVAGTLLATGRIGSGVFPGYSTTQLPQYSIVAASGTDATSYSATGSTRAPDGYTIAVGPFNNTNRYSQIVFGTGNGGVNGFAYVGGAAHGTSYLTNLIFGRTTGSASYAESMRIDGSTGYLGIATETPLALLSVGSGSLADSNVPIQISTAGANTQTWMGFNKNGAYGLLVGFQNAAGLGTGGMIRQVSADPLYFIVNNVTEAMRINSSAQLMINTTAVSTFSKLNLGNTGIDLQVDATTTASTKMNANATNNVLAIRAPFSTNPSAAGNAGAKWGIWFSGGPSYDTVNYPYTSTEAATTSIGKSAAIYAVSEDSAAGYNRQIGLAFYTSNFDANMGERVRIDRAGNVGIGTTSPNQKLEIKGGNVRIDNRAAGSYSASDLEFLSGDSSGSWNVFKIRYTKNATLDRLEFIDGGNSNAFVIANGGNVTALGNLAVNGTGTSTINNLSIAPTSGHVYLTGPNTAGKFITLQNGNATGGINFRDSAGNEVASYYQVTDAWTFSKNTTISGNLTVSQNLIVNGTTTTINSTVTTIDDPIITLGGDTAPTVDDNKDRGIEFRWHNGSAAKVGFFGFDDSTGYFTFIPDATNSSEVFSGTQGDIQASNFRGTLIGSLSNALTAGSYLTGSPSSSYNGSVATTFNVDATSANTANKVVARDGNGDFSARIITATTFSGALSGNSSTTTKLNVTDSRNTADTPETISMGVVADFKANATNSLSDGGTYNGVLTFRQYGSGTDWSGGRSHQLAFTDNDNIWHRSGTSTSWGTWYKIWHQNNDGAGSGLDADLLDGYNQDTANTANTIVRRDASGNFSAGVITGTRLEARNSGTTQIYIDSTNNGSKEIVFQNNGATTGYVWQASTYVGLGGGSGSNSLFVTTSNGNVGVGTTSPNAKLQIGGTTTGLLTVGTLTNDWGGVVAIGTTDGNGIILSKVNAANDSNRVLTLIRDDSTGATIAGYKPNGTSADIGFLIRANASSYFNGGNVGIGTTTPNAKLEVYHSANDVGGIRINNPNSGTAAHSSLSFANSNSSNGAGLVLFGGSWTTSGLYRQDGMYIYTNRNGGMTLAVETANPIYFATNNAERMRIDSSGNVGIGTTSPADLLNIQGTNKNIRVTNTAAYNTSGTAYLGFNGYYNSSNADSWFARIVSGKENTTDGDARGYLSIQTNNPSSGIADRVRIDSNGNLGIGTTTPSAKLDVSGDSVQNVGLVRFTNNYASGNVYYPTASFIQTRGNHSYGIVSEFRTNTAADSDRPSILFYAAQAAHSWQVGQVTSGWGTSDNFGIGYRASNTPGSFSAWPTNYFTITTGGNVGIGTTGPSVKLHVVGSSILANNTSIDPDAYGNTTIAGNIADGGGWGVGAAIGGNNGTGKSWAIGVSGDLYFGYQNGSANDTMQTFMQVGTNRNLFFVPVSGSVGIGTTTPGYKLEVNGSFAATTKSFVIKHPTKEGKKLRYGSLEGPENGVYVRGKTTSKVIELPDYWTKLVDPESISVQLTPIGSHQKLYVEKIENNKVYIANENLLAKNINCFFYILAERADVEKLQVEIDA